ncbi:MAG: MOSC domain-containing protein, partial [Streptosporangiaceae bacterium]
MNSGRVLSVQAGRSADLGVGRRTVRTAIDKRAVAGRVAVHSLGLAGDEQADKKNHGGVDQAVYVYAREDLDFWTEQTSLDLRNGVFGENLTTAGVDVTGALIGETWRIGEVIAQVTAPRIPCSVFASWMDQEHWVKRFAEAGRPGAYLRVLREGMVGAEDDIEILDRPAERITIAEAMRAFYGDADLMAVLLTVPGRGAAWDEVGAEVLARAGRTAMPASGSPVPAPGSPADGTVPA